MIKGLFKGALEAADRLAAGACPGIFPERPAVITTLFHSLFKTEAAARNGSMDPQQAMTVDSFREFVGYFLGAGYTFVTPESLESGLAPGRKYMVITFDDGYFNNALSLPVLEEFQVPAAFYISTDHIEKGKSFWWDALYRDISARGRTESDYYAEVNRFKLMKSHEVEAELMAGLGGKSFMPVGDSDRPFTEDELRDFSAHRFVRLGNHTANHDILTNYGKAEAALQIRKCQDSLKRISGYVPASIAYPNGNFSRDVVDAAMDEGLRIGITVAYHKNPVPLPGSRANMALGRFLLWGDRDVASQAKVFRSDWAPSHFVRRLAKSGY